MCIFLADYGHTFCSSFFRPPTGTRIRPGNLFLLLFENVVLLEVVVLEGNIARFFV